MKKNYILTILAFVLFGILAAFLTQLSQKSSFKVLPLQNDSWRENVRFEKVTKLSEEQRREIYKQVIYQMNICSLPDTAYHKVAKKFGIDVEDIKNIIGEGIASNWKIEEDSNKNTEK